jgi:4a-hydroxytetrahydrobiopterin dehydratase
MRDPVLDPAAIADALEAEDGPDWHLVAGKLVKTVVGTDFMGALAFVMAVGRLADEADHHPDIDIRYRRVTLALFTHDSDGITQRDLDLARAIDGVRDGLPD